MSILLILFFLLQTTFFQNYLADYFTEKLNERTQHSVHFTKLKIKWFDYIQFKGLRITDYNDHRMFYASELEVNYALRSLFNDGDVSLDIVNAQNAHLSLVKHQDTLGINLSEFIREISLLLKPRADSVKKSGVLSVAEVRLDNFKLSYNNTEKDSLPPGKFDYGHFNLAIPVAFFQDFKLHGDTISADIRTLLAEDEATDLEIESLVSHFSLSNHELSLTDLELKTSNSLVKDSIVLKYSGLSDLGTFTDSVSFDLALSSSRISKTDLSYFTDIPIKDFTVDITANISGTVGRMSVHQLRLALGQKTHLVGNIDFIGLPNIKETFIDASISDGEIFPEDIEPYVQASIEKFKKLGDIRFSGRFLGFIYDFVANADFNSSAGFVHSDLNLKFPTEWDRAVYSGKLVLEDFDVGLIMKDTLKIRTINLVGEIDGKGLTRENASFFLNADFRDSQFLGYEFDSIQANGEFASEFFKGDLTVIDPNCQLKTSGTIDIKNRPEQVNVSMDIGYANFKNLGMVKEELEVRSGVKIDVTGLNIDSLQGTVNLNDTRLSWKGDSIQVDTVSMASHKNNGMRSFMFSMPELDFTLEGDFDFTSLARDVQTISKEIVDYFDTDYEVPASDAGSFDDYTIDFQLNYRDPNKYLALIHDDLFISPEGRVEGVYYQRKNATLNLFSEIDSIYFKGIGYRGNIVDLNFSKEIDSQGIIASAFLNSENQVYKNVKSTKNLAVDAVWFNNKIDFNLAIEQPENNTEARIESEMLLKKDRLTFRFLPSEIKIFGQQWFFNPYNKIEVTRSKVLADRLELYRNTQSVLLRGTYSDSTETDMSLEFTEFDLATLNAALPVDIQGILNSHIKIDRDGVDDNYKMLGNVAVDTFRLNGFPVGNITGESSWHKARRGLYLNFDVERKSINTINVEGYYTPQDSINELDINARFNEANLVLLSPLLVNLASDIDGNATGSLDITGFLSKPILNGVAEVTNGKFKLDVLGTVNHFSGNVDFDNQAINFNGIRLTDRDGDIASLSGALRHNGLKDFYVDLSIAANNFMFLNTTSRDNSTYYGTANATGDIIIQGPFNNLYIKADAITNKGTKLYIPLYGSTDVSQKEYISFVNFADSSSHVDLDELVKQNLSGVTLDFEVDVTPDAYVELIFDLRTGDIIRGRGAGNLNMSLDTNGEFELFGDITIEEGGYNFTIPNLINKEFKIVPGSTITWYGDPLMGILDLEATYRQLACFCDFETTGDETVAQKYPMLVGLDLTGEMLSPNIDFEIRYDNSQGVLSTSDQLILNKINNNPDELKQQVFSLLILRKFTDESSALDVGGAPQGSLSEFLTNQFSYFISQVDENLEIDLDLASLDQDAFNTFQLRLSYTFLDGRLRVSGGGSVAQNAEGTAANDDFYGDWSVRYLLTPDGHLRVKAFSQNEQFAGDWQRESGVSFQYLKSFDDFRELLSKTREETVISKQKDMSKEKQANQTKGS